MKEATGELNTAVVTVILVASLASFFYFTIWPNLRSNMNQNIGCSKAICPSAYPDAQGNNKETVSPDGTIECRYIDNNGTETKIRCPWKG